MRESSFITLDRCHVHDTGNAAVTANDTGSLYEGLHLVRNRDGFEMGHTLEWAL